MIQSLTKYIKSLPKLKDVDYTDYSKKRFPIRVELKKEGEPIYPYAYSKQTKTIYATKVRKDRCLESITLKLDELQEEMKKRISQGDTPEVIETKKEEFEKHRRLDDLLMERINSYAGLESDEAKK